jgi:hypothetical protein
VQEDTTTVWKTGAHFWILLIYIWRVDNAA